MLYSQVHSSEEKKKKKKKKWIILSTKISLFKFGAGRGGGGNNMIYMPSWI